MNKSSSFSEKVYKTVKLIPEGKVATYGQIAAMIGNPRSARLVGFALRRLGLEERDIPWWRVINSTGWISINHGEGGVEKNIQRILLMEDGVKVDSEYKIDLTEYLWRSSESSRSNKST